MRMTMTNLLSSHSTVSGNIEGCFLPSLPPSLLTVVPRMVGFSSRFSPPNGVGSPRAFPLRRRPTTSGSAPNAGHHHHQRFTLASLLRVRGRNSPPFWIGASMFCLVLLYVLAVVAVTRFHVTHGGGGDAGAENKAASSVVVGVPPLPPPPPPALTTTAKTTSGKSSPLQKDTTTDAKTKKPLSPLRQVKPQALIPLAQNSGGTGVESGAGVVREQAAPQHVLHAYLETPNLQEWDVKPLPIRQKAKAELLTPVAFPNVNSCSRLTEQWPVDESPSDSDPFLPWIHDVFPTADGEYIQFVAQNKRRCKTGSKETDILEKMQPQVALFQHVPIQRIPAVDGAAATNRTRGGGGGGRRKAQSHARDPPPRYKLVPYEQADPDGITTRFICRFKPGLQETLSVFNFDYDWTSFRKRYKAAFLKDGDGGIKSIHTTQLIFKCPVPPELQETIRKGTSVHNDYATLFVDLIPIRTPPRYGIPNRYLAPWYAEFNDNSPEHKFDPQKEWGDAHIVPAIEDSGRWENIPICQPSLMTYENQSAADIPLKLPEPSGRNNSLDTRIPKKHRLVSCLWASAGYQTRGERFAVNDGQRRLLEWITHNRNIGFDHFYVYDNSAAFGTDLDLKGIADLFPGVVTRIPWPSKICNNRPNNVDSPGERSSQYAAESSCRLRFGPHVEWIGQFDIDEYLIPMGEHKTALSLLDKLDQEDTRIISFGSWRAWPRYAYIDTPIPITNGKDCWSREPCFDLRIPLNVTMLQAYNCDRQPPGKKTEQMPAEKQIYRADYVTQHFVHYSAATVLSALNSSEYDKAGFDFGRRPFPDPRQRFANEVEEGLMIHSKAVAHQDTAGWERVCHVNSLKDDPRDRGLCRLGIPWPDQAQPLLQHNATADGWLYNCFVNKKVEEVFVPQLEAALHERMRFFDAPAKVAE